MANGEPKRPYYVKPEKKSIVLRFAESVIKPLRVSDGETTFTLVVKQAPRSEASRDVIDG